MDRVLLIIDDIQYSRHVEMTLRKVGFEVEAINNEFNVNETLLTYNPDYIICRGNSNRLSVLNVARKLKEGSRFNGKVVLIFPEGFKLSPDDLIQMKMDLLLFEPMSTLRLAVHLFSFSSADFEFVKDKLLKFAITDNQFRNYEQTILKSAGMTFDSEIQYVSSMAYVAPPKPVETEQSTTDESNNINFIPGEGKKDKSAEFDLVEQKTASSTTDVAGSVGQDSIEEKPVEKTEPDNHVEPQKTPQSEMASVVSAQKEKPHTDVRSPYIVETTEDQKLAGYDKKPVFPEPEPISDGQIAKINKEIASSEAELSLRIDSYNHTINKVDQDLKSGLKKKQTKREFNKLYKDLMNEGKSDTKSDGKLDEEKVRFANAMFKKNKKE